MAYCQFSSWYGRLNCDVKEIASLMAPIGLPEHDTAGHQAFSDPFEFGYVLLDVLLKETTGLDVLASIQAIDRRLPVIFITAEADCETAIAAVQLGAFDYVSKPLDVRTLDELVHKAARTREMMNVPVALGTVESVDPSRDMPRGILFGLLTLLVSAGLILWLNPAVTPGAFKLGSSGEPLLDGFRATFGSGLAKGLALVACVGLVASFHTILFAKGRQIYSLSRAGYFPRFLSITHPRHKTPHVALLAGSGVALALMLALWFGMGAEKGAAVIQGMLLNMAFTWVLTGPLHQATWVPLIPVVLVTPFATFALNRQWVFA